jgi:hypothetical protein
MDDGVLASDVRTLVGNPGNGRYFTVTRGPVSIFVIDSGINSSDELVEPDANYAGGKQYNESPRCDRSRHELDLEVRESSTTLRIRPVAVTYPGLDGHVGG